MLKRHDWPVDALGLDDSLELLMDTVGLNGPPEWHVDTLGLNNSPELRLDTLGLKAVPGGFLEGVEILCGSSSSMKNAPQRARVFYSHG